MLVSFEKFHGAGNDFIMIDWRNRNPALFTWEIVKNLCDRHFGIGADGLILLCLSENSDFRMIYFNSDGREGSMCGNGGRCITAFAEKLQITGKECRFEGVDGLHHALSEGNGMYSVKMIDVKNVSKLDDDYFLDTGSPHFVQFRENIAGIDVYHEGRKIRHEKRFGEKGTNVNFVERLGKNEFRIRTFERGVEDETLACGTGSVAAAISSYLKDKPDKTSYRVYAPGGNLRVDFKEREKNNFTDIWLSGPAEFVFSGEINL